jgi:hypothetical protein
MIPLVEIPELVQHYAPYFADLFSEEAFVEFERYISGLIVSENKTVEGINRLFVNESRSQSSLNRLLTRSPYQVSEINRIRLKLLSELSGTRMKPDGVLGIDDTLLTHFGHHFEGIAYLFDHTSGSYEWAHNLVTLHYSDEQTDYPVLFQLWQPAELEKIEAGLIAAGVKVKTNKQELKTTEPPKWRQYLLNLWRRHAHKPEVAALYDSKLQMAKAFLLQWQKMRGKLELPVTFDSWYTQPDFCRYLDQTLHMSYVGTLKETAKIVLKTGEEKIKSFADRLKQEHLAAVKVGAPPVFKPVTISYKGGEEHYFSYCATHRIHTFGKQRLVINFDQADLSDDPVFYISNRLRWQAPGITRIRRHRWPVEVYHEEGKAEGLDQYQLRGLAAIGRHVAFVAVVYSLLCAAQHDTVFQDQLQRELKLNLEGSAASWRRATQAQVFWSLLLFVSLRLSQGQSLDAIAAPMMWAIYGC